MISKILVPTDGSESARKAMRYAVDLAKQTSASIHALTVINKGFYQSQSVPASVAPLHLIEPLEDYLKQVAEASLDEVERLCRKKGVRSTRAIRAGHPVQAILKEAGRSKVDLIVMGSHGKSALKAATLGSITFGVIHKDTKVPVLVVRR